MDAWPACVTDLPVCPVRGLPIPFSSGRGAAGAGLFGVNDPAAKLACAICRMCGVCGKPLEDEIVFLAAVPAGQVLTRPVFPDPAMHETCAETAMVLCPYITRPKARGWLMWVTGSYEMVPGRHSPADFLPAPALRVRRFAYNSGFLAEAVPPEHGRTT